MLSIGALNLFASQTAGAARIWDGGDGSNVWVIDSPSKKNWDGDSNYLAGEDVIFTGIAQLAPSIGSTNLTSGSITFASAGAFTIGGSAILTINGGVVNNDNSLQSFSVTTITLGDAQTWDAGSIAGGSLDFTGSTLNLGSQILTVAGTNNTTITNQITGAGTSGVTKSGAGTLVLGGATANTYSGTTTVSAGTLSLGKSASVNAFGGDLLINGGTLNYSSTINNQIPDTANVTLSSGSLVFGARNETIGGVSAGSFAMSGGSLTIGSGTINLTRNPTISGGTISFTAGGTLQLNTELVFNGGTIDFNNASGSATLNLRGGTGSGITYQSSGTSTATISDSGAGDGNVSLNTSGTTVFNIADSASVATEMSIAASITGGTALQKSGAGVLQLSGANTYGSTTTISAGTLSAGNIVVSGGSSNLGNATSAVVLGDASNQGTLSYTGGAASYTRGFTIQGGGGQLSNAGSGLLTVQTGTVNSGGLFTVGGAVGKDISISSVISGTGGLTKAGADTVTLSGTNLYAGITSITDGALVVNGNQSGATGEVTAASIAKLFGNGTIGGATTIHGTQSAGASSGAIGTQTFSSSLKYDTGSIFEWDINVTGGTDSHDKVAANSLSGSGAEFRIVGSGDGYGAAFWNSTRNWTAGELFGVNNAAVNLATIFTTTTSFNPSPPEGYFSFTSTGVGVTGNQLTWTAVPEPTSALAGILLGASLLRRRRNPRQSALQNDS